MSNDNFNDEILHLDKLYSFPAFEFFSQKGQSILYVIDVLWDHVSPSTINTILDSSHSFHVRYADAKAIIQLLSDLWNWNKKWNSALERLK